MIDTPPSAASVVTPRIPDAAPETSAHDRLLANAQRIAWDQRTDAQDSAIAAEIREDAETLQRRIWTLELRLRAYTGGPST